MLLEQLVEKAAQPPEYDWDAYYRWLFSQSDGGEATHFRFWLCPHCHTVNVVSVPARYGKCRGCDVIQLP
ncbi:MAG TPA: hypothetical protein VL949_09415 [Geobacteraceae bacterium]|nr:hypothetical protein [Geobacteraceae bacterium]